MPPLSVDLFDLENGILLTMTLGPAISLSPAELVDTNLVVLDVGLECGYNAGTFNVWSAKLDFIFLERACRSLPKHLRDDHEHERRHNPEDA